MRILLMAREGVGDHIRDAITGIVPDAELFPTVDHLVRRIRYSDNEPLLAVLIAGSKSDVACIQQIKWLLLDISTILILPDRDLETVTAGYNIDPCFMGCLDDEATAITGAVRKILERQS